MVEAGIVLLRRFSGSIARFHSITALQTAFSSSAAGGRSLDDGTGETKLSIPSMKPSHWFEAQIEDLFGHAPNCLAYQGGYSWASAQKPPESCSGLEGSPDYKSIRDGEASNRHSHGNWRTATRSGAVVGDAGNRFGEGAGTWLATGI